MSEQIFLQLESEVRASYNAYAEGLDSKNWEQVRSCFADEVYLDYGAVIDPEGGAGKPRSADDWVKQLHFNIGGFDYTRHTITNHRTTVEGDVVTGKAYLVADHVIYPDPAMPIAGAEDIATVVGEYTNQYARVNGELKILKSKLVMSYSTGNIALFEKAVGKIMSQQAEEKVAG